MVWISPRFPQILPRIIQNPLYQINSSRIISQQPMPTGNSVCIPLPIKTMRKNSNSIVGCKNHVLVDCISGLPIYEITTTAEAADSSVVLDILADTHRFLPLTECTFLADKGCDVKNIYNQISCLYNGECIIPLNKRNTKNPKLLPQGNPVCEAGLSMWKDRKFSKNRHTRQKFCCPLKNSKNEVCSCHHKNFYNGKKHRGCTKYITVPNDLRLSIDRVSQYFKSTYSLKAECKRYHSRFKTPGRNVCGTESIIRYKSQHHCAYLSVNCCYCRHHYTSKSVIQYKIHKADCPISLFPYGHSGAGFGLTLALLCHKTIIS